MHLADHTHTSSPGTFWCWFSLHPQTTTKVEFASPATTRAALPAEKQAAQLNRKGAVTCLCAPRACAPSWGADFKLSLTCKISKWTEKKFVERVRFISQNQREADEQPRRSGFQAIPGIRVGGMNLSFSLWVDPHHQGEFTRPHGPGCLDIVTAAPATKPGIGTTYISKGESRYGYQIEETILRDATVHVLISKT